jgi:putative ABC transport system permease protein
MFKNYFKTAWRGLLRGRGFSLINISGLVVGMAGATLILLWLFNEVSFDRFHVNKDRIYQVYSMTDIPGEKHQTIDVVSQPLGPGMKRDFPEVETFSRVGDVDHFLFTTNGKSFTNIQGAFVDVDFLRVFSFPLKAGNISEQLTDPAGILITERLALKLFGTMDAVGKMIRLDSLENFTVTGILKDLPANTQFGFDYLLPWSYLRKLGWNNDDWISNNTPTYLLLKPNTNIAAFNEKIRNFTRVKTGRSNLWVHFLYPLSQRHLYSEFDNGVPAGGKIGTVRIFGLIASFILLIACINFMNLSTARSEKRAKEVGIRKVAGAGRRLLIGQFMAEAFLTACIAGALSLLLVQLVLPAFSVLVGVRLSVPYSATGFWVCAFGFVLFTSLLAGSYPAFYLSAFKPAGIFRKQFKRTQALFSPRKVLVVLQFSFAVILIISTLIVRSQLQYAEDRNPGYSRDGLVYVNFIGNIDKNYPLIRQELISQGIASSVSKNWRDIVNNNIRGWGLRWPGENPKDTNTAINYFSSDADLVRTAGLRLLAGRDIDIYQHPTDSLAMLLNETAVKLMGFTNPLGEIIRNPFENRTWHVVGVVKDYIAGSPYARVPPTVIMGPGADFSTMHIRFNPAHTTADNLAGAARIFKQYNPAYPFDYQFVDEQYGRKFENEQRTRTMAGLFAGLAITISCLGLFGLSAYVAESRVKEIGVRKVLGASVMAIAKLLSLEFIRLVLVSIVIASPLAWYAMNRWLADYTYRISIGWGTFFAAGILAVGIAVVTVSFQAVKAALANPVTSLRSE